jgi:hypothetical protein
LEIGRGNGRELWQLPTSDAEEEALVAELYEYLQVEALPVFERASDMHTYAEDARRIAEKYPANALAHEAAFYAALISGDLPAALHAAIDAEDSARADGRANVIEIADRVARIADLARQNPAQAIEILHLQADETRRHIGIAAREPEGP